MYVRIFIYLCVYVFVYVFVCLYVCLCVYLFMYLCAFLCVCMYVYMYGWYFQAQEIVKIGLSINSVPYRMLCMCVYCVCCEGYGCLISNSCVRLSCGIYGVFACSPRKPPMCRRSTTSYCSLWLAQAVFSQDCCTAKKVNIYMHVCMYVCMHVPHLEFVCLGNLFEITVRLFV